MYDADNASLSGDLAGDPYPYPDPPTRSNVARDRFGRFVNTCLYRSGLLHRCSPRCCDFKGCVERHPRSGPLSMVIVLCLVAAILFWEDVEDGRGSAAGGEGGDGANLPPMLYGGGGNRTGGGGGGGGGSSGTTAEDGTASDGTVGDGSGEVASSAPTAETRYDQTLDRIKSISYPSSTSDPRSPQSLAASWISDGDELELPPDSPYFVQRYVLAVLYYSLGIDRHFEGSDAGDRWLGDGTECGWAGLTCDDASYVTEIRLVNMYVKGEMGLSGHLPPELSALSTLRVLDLRHNRISGTLPPELGYLSNLVDLSLDNNDLVGTVPNSLCSLVEGGTLQILTTDCEPGGAVTCGCCTSCPAPGEAPPPAAEDCLEVGTECSSSLACCTGLCMGAGACGYADGES